jgi:hypothetical protein
MLQKVKRITTLPNHIGLDLRQLHLAIEGIDNSDGTYAVPSSRSSSRLLPSHSSQ